MLVKPFNRPIQSDFKNLEVLNSILTLPPAAIDNNLCKHFLDQRSLSHEEFLSIVSQEAAD